ncbi:MAG: hypothetical protein FGM33_02405 [Candidatus Kapabacteria bacterium]|nr:hypothetical protein [Candidatus Kapabacteria bacterium]
MHCLGQLALIAIILSVRLAPFPRSVPPQGFPPQGFPLQASCSFLKSVDTF